MTVTVSSFIEISQQEHKVINLYQKVFLRRFNWQLKAEKIYMKTLTKLLSILYKLRKIIHSKETK